jgi:hypothetical protein
MMVKLYRIIEYVCICLYTAFGGGVATVGERGALNVDWIHKDSLPYHRT